MGIVSQWLKGIGLSRFIPQFKKAGITTPAKLSKLELSDYEALIGPDADENDCKKLWYLVQRIRMAFDDDEDGDDDQVDDSMILEDNNDNDNEEEELELESTFVLEEEVKSQTRSRRSVLPRPSTVDTNPSIASSSSHATSSNSSSTETTNRSAPLRRSKRLSSAGRAGTTTKSLSQSLKTASASKSVTTTKSTSAVARDRNSRIESNTTVQTRRSKRLSTIPSEKEAPMSPLDADKYRRDRKNSTFKSGIGSTRRLSGNISDMNNPRPSSERRRSSSFSSSNVSSDESVTSRKSTGRISTRRLSMSDRESSEPRRSIRSSMKKTSMDERRKSASSELSRRLSTSKKFDETKSVLEVDTSQSIRRKSMRRSSSAPMRSPLSDRSPTDNSNNNFSITSDDPDKSFVDQSVKSRRTSYMGSKSNSSLPAVYIHGQGRDNSWATLVDSHRQENEERVYENDGFNEEDMRIRVAIRKRPMSIKESKASEADVIQPVERTHRLFVYQPKTRVDLTREIDTQAFAFDNVFGENASNAHIYDETTKGLIPAVFDGNMASVFAYGQTGSGKTFTMMGSNMTGKNSRIENNSSTSMEEDNCRSNLGLYYLAAIDVFRYAQQPEFRDMIVGASLFEIYGGKLYDLLNQRNLVKCLEDHRGKVCFAGLSEVPVETADQLMEIIEQGAEIRSTGTTSANADSSRSHAVLQISLRREKKRSGQSYMAEHGRLSFIDLAGSERGGDTKQSGKTTRMEGAEINTSLLALKEVIRALATGDSMQHIPFRGSKLTQVLKESFVGDNCKTVMIACVAPNISNCEHTLNTLRYADRVKERNAETGRVSIAMKKKRTPALRNRADNRRSSVGIPFSRSTTRPTSAPLATTGKKVAASRSKLTNAIGQGQRSEILQPRLSPSRSKDTSTLSLLHSSIEEEKLEYSLSEEKSQTDHHRNEERKSFNSIESSVLSPTSSSPASKLLGLHRNVMKRMMDMLKIEMKLIHATDNDEDMRKYTDELTTVMSEKADLIANLREALSEFKDNSNHRDQRQSTPEDFYEDLRISM